MARQSNLKVDERQEAVLSVLRREETAAVVARRYSISEPTLATWRNQFIEGGKGALQPGSKERNAHKRALEDLHVNWLSVTR